MTYQNRRQKRTWNGNSAITSDRSRCGGRPHPSYKTDRQTRQAFYLDSQRLRCALHTAGNRNRVTLCAQRAASAQRQPCSGVDEPSWCNCTRSSIITIIVAVIIIFIIISIIRSRGRFYRPTFRLSRRRDMMQMDSRIKPATGGVHVGQQKHSLYSKFVVKA